MDLIFTQKVVVSSFHDVHAIKAGWYYSFLGSPLGNTSDDFSLSEACVVSSSTVRTGQHKVFRSISASRFYVMPSEWSAFINKVLLEFLHPQNQTSKKKNLLKIWTKKSQSGIRGPGPKPELLCDHMTLSRASVTASWMSNQYSLQSPSHLMLLFNSED